MSAWDRGVQFNATHYNARFLWQRGAGALALVMYGVTSMLDRMKVIDGLE
jgi:hypothetical protein